MRVYARPRKYDVRTREYTGQFSVGRRLHDMVYERPRKSYKPGFSLFQQPRVGVIDISERELSVQFCRARGGVNFPVLYGYEGVYRDCGCVNRGLVRWFGLSLVNIISHGIYTDIKGLRYWVF